MHRLASLLILPLLAAAAAAEQAPGSVFGRKSVVAFEQYPAAARPQEIARRIMSPLTAAEMSAAADPFLTQLIDLTKERFVLYVPKTPSDRGYRLLVFVPPWDAAELPLGWASVLEREHTIFVSAIESGNDTSMLGRRAPLAVIAAENVLHQFPVDPDRVYVAGFSGGSRVALRLALGYPDLFRGALLNSGSDPIGDAEEPLPPADLFQTFQQSTRLVYLTGNDDEVNTELDGASRLSMANWCVFDLHTMTIFHSGHEVADPASLQHALDTVMTDHAPAKASKLTECRARVERSLAADMGQLFAFLHDGRSDAARPLLRRIDARYGGLAAPKSIEAAKQLAALH